MSGDKGLHGAMRAVVALSLLTLCSGQGVTKASDLNFAKARTLASHLCALRQGSNEEKGLRFLTRTRT